MKRVLFALLTLTVISLASFAIAEDTFVIIPLDDSWVTVEEGKRYAFEVGETSQVIADVFASASCRAEMIASDGTIVDSNWNIYPGTLSRPGTAALGAYVEPGRYEITVVAKSYGGQDNWLPARIRARSRALNAENTGDNSTLTGAYPIETGRLYRILCDMDRSADYYRLRSSNSPPEWFILDAEATFSSLSFEVLDDDGTVLYETYAELSNYYGDDRPSISRQITIYFPSGASVLRVKHPTGSILTRTGVYSFSLEHPPVPRRLKLQKTLRLAPGFSTQLIPISTPVTGVLSNLKWKSSKPSVASVDENGVVTALSKGVATITVQSAGAKASCRVTVGDNEFLKTRPGKPGKGKCVYTFTRRIAYQGDRLAAEVFLVNRTGKTITSAKGLYLTIIDKNNSMVNMVTLGDYTFPKPLKNGSTRIVKALFPKNDKPVLFLPSGDYRVQVGAADVDIISNERK